MLLEISTILGRSTEAIRTDGKMPSFVKCRRDFQFQSRCLLQTTIGLLFSTLYFLSCWLSQLRIQSLVH